MCVVPNGTVVCVCVRACVCLCTTCRSIAVLGAGLMGAGIAQVGHDSCAYVV